MIWFVLGQSGERISAMCAEAAWNYEIRGHSALKITLVLFPLSIDTKISINSFHKTSLGRPIHKKGDQLEHEPIFNAVTLDRSSLFLAYEG